MPHPPALKASLKRGAFIAAANWPLIAVQFIAEGTQQLLLAVPVVGGIVAGRAAARRRRRRGHGRRHEGEHPQRDRRAPREPGRARVVWRIVSRRPSGCLRSDLRRQVGTVSQFSPTRSRRPARSNARRFAWRCFVVRTSRTSSRSSTAVGSWRHATSSSGLCLLVVYGVTAAAVSGICRRRLRFVGKLRRAAGMDVRGRSGPQRAGRVDHDRQLPLSPHADGDRGRRRRRPRRRCGGWRSSFAPAFARSQASSAWCCCSSPSRPARRSSRPPVSGSSPSFRSSVWPWCRCSSARGCCEASRSSISR